MTQTPRSGPADHETAAAPPNDPKGTPHDHRREHIPVAFAAWTCTWCDTVLPPDRYACDDCLAAVVVQLRRRRAADRRLQPLADFAWAA